MNTTRLAILAYGVLLVAGGCVEQKMTITSEPAGAIVEVSGVEKGRTPVTFDYTWIGDYEIVLRLEGHQTLKTHANIKPTWFEIAPLDLFAELSPYTHRDHRYLHYRLEKLALPSGDELIQHAQEMRQRNLQTPPR